MASTDKREPLIVKQDGKGRIYSHLRKSGCMKLQKNAFGKARA
jgi:hypothetical protein